MITIECDNCEREFDVADEEAGQKAACPECGDINRVPDTASPAPAPAPAAAAPSASGDPGGAGELPHDEGPEETIYNGHPAMFRAHPFRFAIILAAFIGGIVLAIMARKWETWDWTVYLWSAISVGSIGYGLLWWLTTVWFKLTVTNKRTIRQVGIIRRDTSEVLHDHVRNVEIKQSFIQRIFKVGYIGISSAGQDDIEIEVDCMPSPYQIKGLIDRYRKL